MNGTIQEDFEGRSLTKGVTGFRKTLRGAFSRGLLAATVGQTMRTTGHRPVLIGDKLVVLLGRLQEGLEGSTLLDYSSGGC